MLAGIARSFLALVVGALAVGVAFAQSGTVVPEKVLKTVPPVYPIAAKLAHVQGSVVLKVLIGKDGRVEEVNYLSGPAVLVQAAKDCVKQWIYSPSTLNGEPLETQTTAAVKFTLSGSPEPGPSGSPGASH